MTAQLAGNRRTGRKAAPRAALVAAATDPAATIYSVTSEIRAGVSRALDEFLGHPAKYPTTRWRAWMLGNYDGDTITVRLDAGMFATRTADLRIYGINAPELKIGSKASRARGLKAKALLATLCPPGSPLELETSMDPAAEDPTEKYGRLLAKVTVYGLGGSTIDLGERMLASGLVKAYLPAGAARERYTGRSMQVSPK